MPEICRFFNIIITMFFNDHERHHKPHFHAAYDGYEASVGIDGELLAGELPSKQLKLVRAWAVIHEDELYESWNNAVRQMPLKKIEPLK